MKWKTKPCQIEAGRFEEQTGKMNKCLDIMPYSDINYKLCYHAPLFSALQYWKIDLDIFFANDIFVYNFYKEEKHVLQCDNIEVIPEKDILNNLGLHWYEIKVFDVNEIINSIEQGYPVFAPIDRYYWKDLKYNASVYMKTHKTHYFLVVGYDIENEEFIVIDVFDSGREFKTFYNRVNFSILSQCVEMYN